MFQLLRDPKIDFMGRRQIWLGVSAAVVVLSIALIVVRGINFGIEFTGGTEVRVQFAEDPGIGTVRGQLESAGINPIVTTIGDAGDNEYLIKVPTQEETSDDQTMTERVVSTLRGGASSEKDLNVVDTSSIEDLLRGAPGISPDQVSAIARTIRDERTNNAIIKSYDQLAGLEGVAPVLDHLRAESELGPLALRSQSYIGPSVGDELKTRASKAILGALIGMLIYIWVRFQMGWGLAAVLTLAHDTLVTIGLFVLYGGELSLPVVAAFLTLVGYSANDTVVVFDRIRENMRRKPKMRMADVINLAINQTLSRTVITSGLTLVVALALFLFGGAGPIHAFSFVLVVGVIVGTYSSIYVASPILLLTRRYLDRGKGQVEADAKATA